MAILAQRRRIVWTLPQGVGHPYPSVREWAAYVWL